MTLILCKKHDTSGFFESCEHVQDLLLNGRPEKVKVIRAHIYQMKICEHCVEHHHIEKYVLRNPDEHEETMSEPDEFWKEFEIAYDEMNNRKAWCTHCYDELSSENKT